MHTLHDFFSSVWISVINSAIATASLIAAVTPNKFDNVVLKCVRAVIDTLALNFGNAENAKK